MSFLNYTKETEIQVPASVEILFLFKTVFLNVARKYCLKNEMARKCFELSIFSINLLLILQKEGLVCIQK